MAITYNWIISSMDVVPADNQLSNVVKVIYWSLVASDDINTARINSTVELDHANPENFTAFDNLTESQVVEWVEGIIDVDNIKVKLAAELNALSNPPVVSRQVPWLVVANNVMSNPR